jgi:signal transduction histidine kinase
LLLDGINQVFREALTCDTLEAVASISLNTALELTQSRFGFLGEITDQGRFIAHAVSKFGWQSCQIEQEKATALLANMEIRGLWGSVLKTGQSLLTNAPAAHPAAAGVPEGHPSITSFLGVPLMQGETVLGMIALANKETHYHENDRSAVESLAIAAVEALNRKRAEIDLKRHRENLESLVEQRTAALKASQAQLIQAEKARALGTMVAGVAHELNNPLTGMLQFTEYCIRHAQDADRIHGVLQDIEHETKRCIRIVGDLLTFSRSEKSEKEAFQKTDLKTLIDRVVRLLSYRIEKEGVSLVCHVAEEARRGWIMPEPFQQVIMNLMTNALDAVADRVQKEIQARVALAEENICISVSDTGCGMSDDTLDKIFDPFFTTKPIGKGTGLGLSISKSIVDAHRGEISCTSAPEKGSVFTVLVPGGKD